MNQMFQGLNYLTPYETNFTTTRCKMKQPGKSNNILYTHMYMHKRMKKTYAFNLVLDSEQNEEVISVFIYERLDALTFFIS